MKFKSLLLAFAVSLLLSAHARATVSMLSGPPIAITGCTFATPIVCTTGSVHGVPVGGLVWIYGVTDDMGANGVFACSAVAGGNTCTLTGSVGTTGYRAGGFLRALGVTGPTVGPWFDCSQCFKNSVFFYSAAGSTGSTNVEGTSSITIDTDKGVPATAIAILQTVANVGNGSAADGFFAVDPAVRYVRINQTALTVGIVYAFLTCDGPQGPVW